MNKLDFFASFEVGKRYRWAISGYDPVKVVRRTEKTVWVDNGSHAWAARVKRDERANEYFVDSGVAKRHRDACTVKACWEVED